jgi:hypothetical protein
VLVSIGPVDAELARRWTDHLLASLSVLAARRDLLPFRLPDEAIDGFTRLLGHWRAHADRAPTFLWEEDLDADEVRMLVQYWANLDSIDEDLLQRLGLTWSPEGTRPFFEAVALGVAVALEDDEKASPFARLLAERGRQGSPG